MGIASADPLLALRVKLVTMRAALIGNLIRSVDGADLALVGSIQGAIDAVDAVCNEARRGDVGRQ
jgi:hypothetical protein